MIVDTRPRDLKKQFAKEYSEHLELDSLSTYNRIITYGYDEHNSAFFKELTERWYHLLDSKGLEEAYSVYGDPYYFVDVIHCFLNYSRQYLRSLRQPSMPDGRSFLKTTEDAKVIVDIGCGIGYSTIALKEYYPNAKVYGINLRDTDQWKFCAAMGEKHGFEMVGDITEIPERVDVVFASEYFEHICDPITHVQDIVAAANPKYFVIANAFNTWSIGHFLNYSVRRPLGVQEIPQGKISRAFNDELRVLGYDKLKTTFYNQKPNIWHK